MRKIRDEASFTYIEALMALVIFSVALAPIIIVFPTGVLEVRLGKNLSIAANLGETLMDEILSKRYDETPRPGNPKPPSALGFAGGGNTGETVRN